MPLSVTGVGERVGEDNKYDEARDPSIAGSSPATAALVRRRTGKPELTLLWSGFIELEVSEVTAFSSWSCYHCAARMCFVVYFAHTWIRIIILRYVNGLVSPFSASSVSTSYILYFLIVRKPVSLYEKFH
ncbi:hypothetical protein PoB_002344800 [Plakobranchus ocellatus]|uniref:Uncharacterized protein n=1 Tax=Plakobranchus ocellatus TaxID=259542 RepID=A0AAV3ZQW0_9GAST|nr:hypothetical protein PoB_002344800 [Plakobranchus ocellatus]